LAIQGQLLFYRKKMPVSGRPAQPSGAQVSAYGNQWTNNKKTLIFYDADPLFCHKLIS